MTRADTLALAREALRRRESATKGVWYASGPLPYPAGASYSRVSACYSENDASTHATVAELGAYGEPNEANAALFAFAANHLAELAWAVIEGEEARISELEAEVERLKSAR